MGNSSLFQTRLKGPVCAAVGVLVLLSMLFTLYPSDKYADSWIRFGINTKKGSISGQSNASVKFEVPMTSNSATDLIFYNKVGKCGSRSLVYLLRLLGKKNNFTAAGENKTRNMTETMQRSEQAALVRIIEDLPRPATFYKQTYFIDFKRFGEHNPTYINVIRQPLSRLVSYYYFVRYGDDKNDKKHYQGDDFNQTFDECVLQGNEKCQNNFIFRIIPHFCGQDKKCREPTRWAIEKAKENVEKYFLVVGLTEEYDETLKLFEKMMPRFFEGALKILQTPGAIRSTKTKKKIEPSAEVVDIMNQRLALENEFYEFIRQRFYHLKAKYGVTQHLSSFRFPKIEVH
ncbi:uronyl 2-sulfotransferase-like [Glandiceps talaboti]